MLSNFLGNQGLRVSKGKPQFVECEIKYLGHTICQGSWRLNPERIKGIVSLLRLKTKREIKRLLGLLGYCRLWIEGYTEAIKFLYEKLAEDEIERGKEDKQKFEDLNQKLVSAPALSLPALDKPFYLFVDAENRIAYGVLAQDWGESRKPVAYQNC